MIISDVNFLVEKSIVHFIDFSLIVIEDSFEIIFFLQLYLLKEKLIKY